MPETIFVITEWVDPEITAVRCAFKKKIDAEVFINSKPDNFRGLFSIEEVELK